jgi:hypothetical protein
MALPGNKKTTPPRDQRAMIVTGPNFLLLDIQRALSLQRDDRRDPLEKTL